MFKLVLEDNLLSSYYVQVILNDNNVKVSLVLIRNKMFFSISC